VIFAALAGNMLIAIVKFIAGAVTGSSAMLSEGIHSVVDTGNQGLLLYGLKQAKQPADERFPFGHGKEVYFWSFVVAIMIFAVGAGVSLYEGVQHMLAPEPIKNIVVNYVVIGLAILFEGAAWYFALAEFTKAKGKWGYVEAVQRGKDPTIFMVLFEDSAAIMGLVVALLGVTLSGYWDLYWADGAASVIIGLILGATAAWLAYETKGLLIGESANRAVVEGIRKTALSCDEIDRVFEVLTMHMGPDFVLVNISVGFKPETQAPAIEAAIDRLDREIKRSYPTVKRVFVEAESRRS